MKRYNYGLLGKNISYSYSKKYFFKKFQELELDNHTYINFDIKSSLELTNFINSKAKKLNGFNVTTPYKEIILPHLDSITKKATIIGAVNVVKLVKGKLVGYNTDVYGFKKTLKPLLKKHHKRALILGTGGASKAIAYALEKCGLKVCFVSRTKKGKHIFSYKSLSEIIIKKYTVIVNTTPLGTFPKIDQYPNIPYQYVNDKHLLFDLIYNPNETLFLKKAKSQGAKISNGLKKLKFQADKTWEIWNESQ